MKSAMLHIINQAFCFCKQDHYLQNFGASCSNALRGRGQALTNSSLNTGKECCSTLRGLLPPYQLRNRSNCTKIFLYHLKYSYSFDYYFS